MLRMGEVQNIGPFGRYARALAGVVWSGVAAYALTRAAKGHARRSLALVAGAAATAAVVSLEEGRRGLCVLHGFVGRQSSESLRRVGRLSRDEKKAARHASARLVAAGLSVGGAALLLARPR
jgi:hypothetical protein